jgi:hypothetical protein
MKWPLLMSGHFLDNRAYNAVACAVCLWEGLKPLKEAMQS